MFDFLFVNHFDAFRNAAAIGFVAWLTWLVARHGVAWVWTKAASAWYSLVGDFSGLAARVTALETDVGVIKTVVPVPAPVAKTVVAVPATKPPTAAPVAPAASVAVPTPTVKTS